MTIKIKGNPLWGNDRKYKCGCIAGTELICPIHNEPLIEQMIYGNEKIGDLNEKKKYEEQNLNEGG